MNLAGVTLYYQFQSAEQLRKPDARADDSRR